MQVVKTLKYLLLFNVRNHFESKKLKNYNFYLIINIKNSIEKNFIFDEPQHNHNQFRGI